jgi:hypothetical protein
MELLLRMSWNVQLGCDTRDRSGEVLESCKSSVVGRSKRSCERKLTALAQNIDREE